MTVTFLYALLSRQNHPLKLFLRAGCVPQTYEFTLYEAEKQTASWADNEWMIGDTQTPSLSVPFSPNLDWNKNDLICYFVRWYWHRVPICKEAMISTSEFKRRQKHILRQQGENKYFWESLLKGQGETGNDFRCGWKVAWGSSLPLLCVSYRAIWWIRTPSGRGYKHAPSIFSLFKWFLISIG